MPDPLVIVGGGLATARVVKSYREAGGDDPIVVVSADSSIPYHRPPLSKRYLRGEVEADGTYVEPAGFYPEHGAELRLETVVERIGEHELELAGGERLAFSRLVLATGATPRRLGLPGELNLRTLADSTAIRTAAADARRAVVVGTGFIGLEVSASLRQLGLDVTIADRGTQLFRPLAAPLFSEYLAGLYREHGVELELGREIDEATTAGADLVVVGIGVTPNVELLEGSPVEVEDGVLVNERFETSLAQIWAVGDVARFFDPVFGRTRRIEHWSNANYQGTELGKLLAGEPGGYDHVSSFFSELFGISIRVLGALEEHDDQQLHGSFEDGQAVLLYLSGGSIVAALALGQADDELARLTELIRGRAAASAYR